LVALQGSQGKAFPFGQQPQTMRPVWTNIVQQTIFLPQTIAIPIFIPTSHVARGR